MSGWGRTSRAAIPEGETLLQLHSARSRSHAAYHAKERRKPSKTNAGAVLKEVRRHVQGGLELEYQPESDTGAGGARGDPGSESALPNPMGRYRGGEPGEAAQAGPPPTLRPRLSLFTKQQKEAESVTESEAPAKGTLHVRTGAALVQSTARQGPAAGWSVTVHEV